MTVECRECEMAQPKAETTTTRNINAALKIWRRKDCDKFCRGQCRARSWSRGRYRRIGIGSYQQELRVHSALKSGRVPFITSTS